MGFLGYVGMLWRLPSLWEIAFRGTAQQTLGKPPHVGTEESHVPVSPLLSTGTGEPSLLGEPCARTKSGALFWGRKEGFAVGKTARAALYDASGLW